LSSASSFFSSSRYAADWLSSLIRAEGPAPKLDAAAPPAGA
jgi:hypothetical protein